MSLCWPEEGFFFSDDLAGNHLPCPFDPDIYIPYLIACLRIKPGICSKIYLFEKKANRASLSMIGLVDPTLAYLVLNH